MGIEISRRELGVEFILKAFAFVLSLGSAFASTLAIIIGGDALVENPSNKRAWVTVGGGLVGLILFISLVFYVTSTGEDNSEHCGPGTEYRESRHYNPSTRITHTDWWCEVK